MTRHRFDEATSRTGFLPPGGRVVRPQAFPEGSAHDQTFNPLPEGEPATQADIDHLQGEMMGMNPDIAQALIHEAGEKGSVDIRIGDRIVNFHRSAMERIARELRLDPPRARRRPGQ